MNDLIKITILSQSKRLVSRVLNLIKQNEQVLLNKVYTDFRIFIRELEIDDTQIGILIIDIEKNETKRLESLMYLHDEFPELKTIAIFSNESPKLTLKAIKYGVKSIIQYNQLKTYINQAILKAHQNRVQFDEKTIFLMVNELQVNEEKRLLKINRIRNFKNINQNIK